MPPAVRGDDGVDRPSAWRAACIQRTPSLGAVGHLEDMRDHVVRARIAGFSARAVCAIVFGPLVLAAFLEAEGVHGEHGVVARQVASTRRAAPPPRAPCMRATSPMT